MASKTERVEMRTDPESLSKLNEAARTQSVPLSAFVLDAAVSAADRLLARRDVTVMDPDTFDSLMDSLEEPDEPTKLREVAKRPRRFTRS